MDKLQKTLDVQGDVGYTCETAGYFFLYQIQSRWEKYLSQVKSDCSATPIDDIALHFPFTKYYNIEIVECRLSNVHSTHAMATNLAPSSRSWG